MLGRSSPKREVVKSTLPPEPTVIVKEKIVEKVVEVRPTYYKVESGSDISKTSMGFDFKSGFEELPGGLASTEREDDGTYEANSNK